MTKQNKQINPVSVSKQYKADEFILMDAWGKDHWSTLAYVETVMVECAGFQVGADPRMRSNRRNLRIMLSGCPRPKRPKHTRHHGLAMRPEHTSRLAGRATSVNHDDWCCLQDMANEHIFTASPDTIEPGVMLHLSPYGSSVVSARRRQMVHG